MPASLLRRLHRPAFSRGAALACTILAAPLLMAARGDDAAPQSRIGEGPAATAQDATEGFLAAAGQHLGPYIRAYGENFSVLPADSSTWVELRGLTYGDARTDTVTAGDGEGGVLRRLHVSLKYDAHRSLLPDGTWSAWQGGGIHALPEFVTVEQHGEMWVATSGAGRLLRPVSNAAIDLPKGASFAVSVPAAPDAGSPAVEDSGSAAIPLPVPATAPLASPPPNGETGAGLAAPVFLGLGGLAVVAAAGGVIGLFRLRNRRDPRKGGPPPVPGQAGEAFVMPDAVTCSQDLSASPFATASGGEHGGARDRTGLAAYTARTHLHTPTEREFHRHLSSVLGSGCGISGKVRLADLFDAPTGPGAQAAFNRVCSKHIDFLIIDHDSSRILGALELDDASHNRPDRQERDRFVNRLFLLASFPLIRIPVRSMHDSALLIGHLRSAGIPLSDTACAPALTAGFSPQRFAPAS